MNDSLGSPVERPPVQDATFDTPAQQYRTSTGKAKCRGKQAAPTRQLRTLGWKLPFRRWAGLSATGQPREKGGNTGSALFTKSVFGQGHP